MNVGSAVLPILSYWLILGDEKERPREREPNPKTKVHQPYWSGSVEDAGIQENKRGRHTKSKGKQASPPENPNAKVRQTKCLVYFVV